jgi:hypothetical protein
MDNLCRFRQAIFAASAAQEAFGGLIHKNLFN